MQYDLSSFCLLARRERTRQAPSQEVELEIDHFDYDIVQIERYFSRRLKSQQT
jgi:hypothetical protein